MQWDLCDSWLMTYPQKCEPAGTANESLRGYFSLYLVSMLMLIDSSNDWWLMLYLGKIPIMYWSKQYWWFIFFMGYQSRNEIWSCLFLGSNMLPSVSNIKWRCESDISRRRDSYVYMSFWLHLGKWWCTTYLSVRRKLGWNWTTMLT